MRSTQRLVRNFDRHPDTANYRARSLSAGATISGSRLTAINKLIKAINNNGLRAIVRYLICPSAQDNFIGFNVPILDDGVGVATNNGFVASDWNNNGLIGNGVGKYLNTQWNPELKLGAFSGSDCDVHLSAWVTAVGDLSGYQGLVGGGDSQNTWVQLYFNATSLETALFEFMPTPPDTAGIGHFIANRTSSTNNRSLKNGALVASSSATATPSPVNFSLFTHCLNEPVGTPDYFTQNRILIISMGAGLAENQENTLYNLLLSFKIAIGA